MGAAAAEHFPFFLIFQVLASNWSAGFWCARRAVAFTAISMGCQDLSSHKVHFKCKKPFQKGRQGVLVHWTFPERSPCPTARCRSRLCSWDPSKGCLSAHARIGESFSLGEWRTGGRRGPATVSRLIRRELKRDRTTPIGR